MGPLRSGWHRLAVRAVPHSKHLPVGTVRAFSGAIVFESSSPLMTHAAVSADNFSLRTSLSLWWKWPSAKHWRKRSVLKHVGHRREEDKGFSQYIDFARVISQTASYGERVLENETAPQ